MLKDNDFSRLINKYCVFCNFEGDDSISGLDIVDVKEVIDVVSNNIEAIDDMLKNF